MVASMIKRILDNVNRGAHPMLRLSALSALDAAVHRP